MTTNDPLARIVLALNLVESNNSKLTETDLIRRIGDEDFNLFSRFCLGGTTPYASTVHEKLFLTQDGVRKLYDLRKVVIDDRREETNKILTTSIAFTGAVLALISILGIFLDRISTPASPMEHGIFWGIVVLFGFTSLVCIIIVFNYGNKLLSYLR